MTRRKRQVSYHILSTIICAGIVILGCLRCPLAFLRFWESVRDFYHSLAYFAFFPVPPTVANVSFGMAEGAPRAWADFVALIQRFSMRFVSADNFVTYLRSIASGLMGFTYFLFAFVVCIGLPFGICLHRSVKLQNRDYNKQTSALQRFLKFHDRVYCPIKRYVKGFFRFFRRYKRYSVGAIAVVLCFTNVYALALEVLAWLFYFCAAFDLPNLGVQAIKLGYDIVLAFNFMPWWCWLGFAFYVIDKIRREIGYRRLEKREDKTRDFIDKRPIVSMICAPMREGKTTFLSSLAMSIAKKMRNDAKDGMRDIDMKFPDFSWIVLEKMIQKEMKRHRIYNLETTREWIEGIFATCKSLQNNPHGLKLYRRRLQKEYGIKFETAFFSYDATRFPMEYNGGLGKEPIENAIMTYAQLYHIYISPTSIIASNYPIRLDDDFDDNGNFPQWEDDFFRKEPSPIEKSQMSHVLVQDSLRLGKTKNPNNPYKDAAEYGIFAMTEIGKERGNQKDMEGVHKSDNECNQKNDLFNSQLKLIGHSATIYYIPFVRFLCDEQRPESWGADARELCDIITIKEKSSDKILMPFFAIEEALYLIAKKVVGKLYDDQRYNRGDHTLSMWLLRTLYKKLYDHFQRVKNTFGGYAISLNVEAGNGQGKMEKSKLFVSRKKVFTNRFDTAAYRGFYAEKAKRSKYGLNDIPVYHDLTPTREEFHLQESHFFEKLFTIFGEQTAQELIAQMTQKFAKNPNAASKPGQSTAK